ncbi:MAG: hypothetical protein HY903_22430 [Deltaproteobacteria bacterium]|nr:hypothetical protein [Deltaproteobacteria bacterium]
MSSAGVRIAIAAAVVIFRGAAPAWAADAAPQVAAPQPEAGVAPDNQLRLQLDLAHTYAQDLDMPGYVSFSDLRFVGGGSRLLGAPLALQADARLRLPSDTTTPRRQTVSEAYAALGSAESWRLSLGRQVVRPLGMVEVDGGEIDLKVSSQTTALAFGGLLPHPFTGAVNTQFVGGGIGYDHRSEASNHAGGAVLSFYRGTTDRAFLTQRSYARLSQDLVVSGFAIVDLLAPRGLFDTGTKNGPDLTSFIGVVRYRGVAPVDSNLSVTHTHTVVPNRWWTDFLNERRRQLGYVLDGAEPLGTRVTSMRFTNNVPVGAGLTPYVRVRYDRRHTAAANAAQGVVGFKWAPRFGYADLNYTHRRAFNDDVQMAALGVGMDHQVWGGDAGAILLRSVRRAGGQKVQSIDLRGGLWLALGELLETLKGVHLLAEYDGVLEPGAVIHAGFVQLGYRR